jgi:nickel-dependent lactate racemase
MAKQEYTFQYGQTGIRFSLDSELVAGELTMKQHPPIQDPAGAILSAIRNPIQSRPFKEIVKPGQTVAFLVNDPTRVANSHVFMPLLLNELNAAGVPDKDMFIMFAVGAHRSLPEQEMVQMVGPEVAKRVKMYNSEARDLSQFKHMGKTSRGNDIYFHKRVVEADHIICTGSIVYHFSPALAVEEKPCSRGSQPMRRSAVITP